METGREPPCLNIILGVDGKSVPRKKICRKSLYRTKFQIAPVKIGREVGVSCPYKG